MSLWRRLNREDPAQDVESELAFHLEMRAREYETAGMDPESARRAAEKSFGDRSDVAEACRRERERRKATRRRREFLRDLTSELRLAVRGLRRSPVFTVAIVLTLGIGIGLTVAVAGLVDAYLVRALPYPEAERLVQVEGPGAPDWRSVPPVLEAVAGWDLDALSIVTGGSPERVWTSWVTPGFFDVLGVRAAHGRLFTGEEVARGHAVAVISHALWQRRWGGDPGVLGQTFSAYSDDRPGEAETFEIIGVLPADFWYVNRFTEVLVPLDGPRVVSLARLAPGVPVASAQAVLEAAARERDPSRADVRVELVHEAFTANVRPVLVSLAGAVLLVLLIACGNAAVLLLVRAASREREFAVRAAIGAGRRRLTRQLLAEGLVLSSVAALTGLAIGWFILEAGGALLTRMLETPVPGGEAQLRLGAVSLAAAAGASALAGLLFALIPLHAAMRVRIAAALGDGSRGSDSRRRQRLRDTLVAAEVALSLSLLVGAGLLVRSAMHLQQLRLGFEPRDVMAVGISLRRSTYPDPATRVAMYERVMQSVRDRASGAEVSMISWAPFSRWAGQPVETPELPAADSAPARAFVAVAHPTYFDVMRIATVRGSGFDATHVQGSPPVAVVSESLARRLWPGQDPIGQRIRALSPVPAPDQPRPEWRTVVGVVADVRKTLTEENPPDLYYSAVQIPPPLAELVVRDPLSRTRLRDVRDAIWSVEPELPLNDVRWLDDDIRAASLPSRFLAGVLAGFALFAVTLATLGLYGAIAYAVQQQRRAIAIRMAMGARREQVVALFVRRGAMLVGAGLLAGLAGSYALARILASQLYGVSSTDPATWLAVAALLGLAALAAIGLPAWRAARTEPARLLHTS